MDNPLLPVVWGQLATSRPLLILREVFTSLLPIVLIMNILALLGGFNRFLIAEGVTRIAFLSSLELSRLYFFLLPLFVCLSLSSILAKEKDLDRLATVLIAMVCFFRLSGYLSVTDSLELASYSGSILTSIPCTWLAVTLLHRLSHSTRFAYIYTPDTVSPRLHRTLSLLIPGVLTVFSFEMAGNVFLLLKDVTAIVSFTNWMELTIGDLGRVREMILFKGIALCSWFFGIHGEYGAEGFFRLFTNDFTDGGGGIQLKTFHDVFMNIGGSGSTFAIPLVILCSRRLRSLRTIASLSLPFAWFNVNEFLLFGLPIVLNPLLLVPFIVVPFINMAIALAAIHWGCFQITSEYVSWMAPPFYSAYAATNGTVSGIAFQGICIVVDACIYYPFLVLVSEQHQMSHKLLTLFGGDVYRLFEEELYFSEERRYFAKQRAIQTDRTAAQSLLKKFRGGDFLLFFQPKISLGSSKLVGLEALIRFRNSSGEIIPPSFLPTLYQQGLSKAIDRKVLDMAIERVLTWRNEGYTPPPISINFDKEFLLDRKLVKEFIDITKQHKIKFFIEITEYTYTTQLKALASVIRELRQAGHSISIDDFGSGYSSLTSLVELEADEIKIDRSLVVPPEHQLSRGEVLLSASIRLCKEMGFSVVTEGIETQAQLETVTECGADVAQGYYLGKPMSSNDVTNIL